MNHVNESSKIRQTERVAARNIDGRAVVVVIDRQKLHVLNPVGTRVWELSDGRTLSSIVDGIVDEFEVDRQTAFRDVLRFVEELDQLGAVQIEKGLS